MEWKLIQNVCSGVYIQLHTCLGGSIFLFVIAFGKWNLKNNTHIHSTIVDCGYKMQGGGKCWGAINLVGPASLVVKW